MTDIVVPILGAIPNRVILRIWLFTQADVLLLPTGD